MTDAPTRRSSSPRADPITVDRIRETALRLVEEEGFDALTMRRVAGILDTGPASLYAHVRNKAELDELLIGELCSRVVLPTPDAARWREQILDVWRQLRDQYLRYPGVSQAALESSPRNPQVIALMEGMLGILLTGGVAAQPAAWALDAASLYIGAYSLEASLRQSPDSLADEREVARDELIAQFERMDADRFPNTVAHARELTSGTGHERFDFTLRLLLQGLEDGPAS